MSLLLLFFGVAIFSPLHVHTRQGDQNSCSFNDIEHQMVSNAEIAFALAPLALLIETGEPPFVAAPADAHEIAASGRAPPTYS